MTASRILDLAAPARSALIATALLIAGACSSDPASSVADAAAPCEACAADGGLAGDGGDAGNPSDSSAGSVDGGGGASDGSAGDGAVSDGGALADGSIHHDADVDGGCCDGGREPPLDLAALLENGAATTSQAQRPAYGALVVASDGERSYAVESRRVVEPGPFGLPWRTRFRLAAYDAGIEVWAYEAEPEGWIGDVAVHPSGEVTLSLQRHVAQEKAYDLVRLTRAGDVIGTTTLDEPATVPESDYGPADVRPLLRMKAQFPDATTAGWVRLLPEGEGVTAAILTRVYPPPNQTATNHIALALARFDWEANAYVERWTRIVDGTHGADPGAWTYDELRWREQAVRPFLARDDDSGDIFVGRAWNQLRCTAHRDTFGEFTEEDCVLRAANVAENERLPLAVTRFGADGERFDTSVLFPDADTAEQLPFALAVRDGQLALAGAVVRKLENGAKRTYDGFVDYDGYISVYDAGGDLVLSRDFNLGRGDMLAALHWTASGMLAVGSVGWDRWQGGMSISRGADPVFVWLSSDGTQAATRVVPLSAGNRHFNLHDVVVRDDAVIGWGFSDAPMTHSADSDNSARTFGPLQVRLSQP